MMGDLRVGGVAQREVEVGGDVRIGGEAALLDQLPRGQRDDELGDRRDTRGGIGRERAGAGGIEHGVAPGLGAQDVRAVGDDDGETGELGARSAVEDLGEGRAARRNPLRPSGISHRGGGECFSSSGGGGGEADGGGLAARHPLRRLRRHRCAGKDKQGARG